MCGSTPTVTKSLFVRSIVERFTVVISIAAWIRSFEGGVVIYER